MRNEYFMNKHEDFRKICFPGKALYGSLELISGDESGSRRLQEEAL